MKEIPLTVEQLLEVNKLLIVEKGLSQYDLINFVLARDNNYILATGDNKLKNYSEANGVEVIRTLKIIELMRNKNVLTQKEAINACINLKENNKTRIPLISINEFIKKLQLIQV